MLYKWLARRWHTSARRARKKYSRLNPVDQCRITMRYIENAGSVRGILRKPERIKL